MSFITSIVLLCILPKEAAHIHLTLRTDCALLLNLWNLKVSNEAKRRSGEARGDHGKTSQLLDSILLACGSFGSSIICSRLVRRARGLACWVHPKHLRVFKSHLGKVPRRFLRPGMVFHFHWNPMYFHSPSGLDKEETARRERLRRLCREERRRRSLRRANFIRSEVTFFLQSMQRSMQMVLSISKDHIGFYLVKDFWITRDRTCLRRIFRLRRPDMRRTSDHRHLRLSNCSSLLTVIHQPEKCQVMAKRCKVRLLQKDILKKSWMSSSSGRFFPSTRFVLSTLYHKCVP